MVSVGYLNIAIPHRGIYLTDTLAPGGHKAHTGACVLSLPVITGTGTNLNVHQKGTDWVDYNTPVQWDSSALQGMSDSVCADMGWMPRYIAKWKHSGNTLHYHLGFKKKDILVCDRIFWKDTKETANSGMPLKKDTGDWRSGRGKETYFSLYSLLCSLGKKCVFTMCMHHLFD